MKKLHLGCGERYLKGYINIDFPSSEHTVQKKSVADEHHNLLELAYEAGSVDEIRLHHVFEHFDRPTALGLLFAWNTWLKDGGILRIEVPDYFFSGLLSLFSPLKKMRLVATRHIFGSHEASWAIHAEGWTRTSLRDALKLAGFELVKTRRNYWRGTVNLDVSAKKVSEGDFSKLDKFFSQYLLDQSESELRLKEVWKELFYKQYAKSVKR